MEEYLKAMPQMTLERFGNKFTTFLELGAERCNWK